MKRTLAALGLLLCSGAAVADTGLQWVPLGYCQLTSIDTVKKLSNCSGGIPSSANFAVITAEAQAVRYRDDGVNPTTTVGMPVAVGAPFQYSGTLSAFAVVSQTSGGILNVSFYR